MEVHLGDSLYNLLRLSSFIFVLSVQANLKRPQWRPGQAVPRHFSLLNVVSIVSSPILQPTPNQRGRVEDRMLLESATVLWNTVRAFNYLSSIVSCKAGTETNFVDAARYSLQKSPNLFARWTNASLERLMHTFMYHTHKKRNQPRARFPSEVISLISNVDAERPLHLLPTPFNTIVLTVT